jgi:hypothetical protein
MTDHDKALSAPPAAQAGGYGVLINEGRDLANGGHPMFDKPALLHAALKYAEKAANAIEVLRKRSVQLEAALRPFANYASKGGFGLDYHGKPLPDGEGVGWVYLTYGDFRRAADPSQRGEPCYPASGECNSPFACEQAGKCLSSERPPAALASELAQIEEMLNAGQGDDDGPPILPKFEPGMSVAAKVESCLHLLEKRRDVIAGREGDWRDDPSADERWNAGCDYAMTQLCAILKVDPQSVSWDAATETLDGDVRAVLHGILTAGLGEDWNEPPAPADVAALLEDLHELDWGALPAVGRAAATIEAAMEHASKQAQDIVALGQLAGRAAELEAALREARLQIEYLHGKYQETGSGNAVLARIDAALSDAPAAKGGE